MTESKEVAVAQEKLGIVETQEAMKGVIVLAIFIAKRLRDGAGIDDAIALFTKASTDAEFKAVITEAYEGIDKVPAEVKDVDLMESVALIQDLIKYVPQILEAMKKEEKVA